MLSVDMLTNDLISVGYVCSETFVLILFYQYLLINHYIKLSISITDMSK
jgi:hypothetical protein